MRKLTVGSAPWVRELIHAAVRASDEQRFLHRLHCVLLVGEGRSCYEVARWFGQDPRTIERWVHAMGLRGAEGLRQHHVGGRPAKLAGEQLRLVALDLRTPPDVCGYSKREWSGALLTQHLDGRYGVKLSRTPMPTHVAPARARRGKRDRSNALIVRQGFVACLTHCAHTGKRMGPPRVACKKFRQNFARPDPV